MFIVFEGVDGSGKTTQLRLLSEALTGAGMSVACTREPGGSPTLGPALRELLLHTGGDLCARAEALLFAAERAEHVDKVIEPALAAGQVVLCDRFTDSTLGYQGAGRGLDEADLVSLCDFATAGLVPDVVVVVDVPVEVGQSRQGERGAADRMEAAGLSSAVRALLLRRASQHPDRYVVVDGAASPAQVHERVMAGLMPRLAQLAA